MKIGRHARNPQCVFSFPLEPRVDFSVQLCQWENVPALSRVLRFTPDAVTVSKCCLRNCKFPLFKQCSSCVLRTEAISSGYCRPFPV